MPAGESPKQASWKVKYFLLMFKSSNSLYYWTSLVLEGSYLNMSNKFPTRNGFLFIFFKFHFITAYKSKKNTKNYPTEGTVYPPHYPYEKFTVTPLHRIKATKREIQCITA